MSLSDYKAMMDRCSSCLNCKWIPFDKVKSQRFGENCPAVCFSNFNTYSARGRFQMANAILEGRINYTDESARVVHQCLSCGACDVACKVCRYNLEPLEHNIALKEDAIEKGFMPEEAGLILHSLREEKTMIPGAKREKRMNWQTGLQLKNALQEEADILLFAGCKYSYDEKLSAVLHDMTAALIKSGISVGTLGNADMCCGGRLQQMGQMEAFREQCHANIEILSRAKAKMLVVPCADCYFAFKRLYAAEGLNIEVLHMTEYLARLIDEGRLELTEHIDKAVTYHDPCRLGRLGEPYIPWEGKEKKIFNQIHTWEPRRPRYNGAYGVYDAPRHVLQSIPGLQLKEMERIREYSWCCGAGSCQNVLDPEFSEWTANERMTEAVCSGAEAVVTACPWCNNNLGGSVGEDGRTLEVIDIMELVLSALGKEGR